MNKSFLATNGRDELLLFGAKCKFYVLPYYFGMSGMYPQGRYLSLNPLIIPPLSSIFNQVIRILQKPYPISSRHNYVLHSIGFGLFVFLFLYLLKPFDMGLFGDRLLEIALGYGAITTGIMLATGFVLFRVLLPRVNEEKWTLGKMLGWDLMLMVFIAIGNTFYAGCVVKSQVPLLEYFVMLKSVLLLGIFPIVISELLVYNWNLRKNLQEAGRLSSLLETHHQTTAYKASHPGLVLQQTGAEILADAGKEDRCVILQGENQNELLELPAESLLAIQSMDNYITVYWEENGRAKSQILRNTLTNIANQLSDISCMFRCHRAWMVNIRQVEQVEGNAQGYRLQLPFLKFEVPVSRSNTVLYRQLTESYA